MMFNLRLIAIIAAASLIAIGGAYLKGRMDGMVACAARHARAAQAALVREQAIGQQHSAALEKELSAVRQYATRLERLVSYEIDKHRGDYGYLLPAGGVRILNDAIAGRPTGEPDNGLQ